MFAGPNGSGKSTIKNQLKEEWLGTYINADEIEKLIKQDGFLDLATFGLSGENGQQMAEQFKKSTRAYKAGWKKSGNEFRLAGLHVSAHEAAADSYFAAEVADYIRHSLLDQGTSFTFETVMSFHDKVAFMEEAQRRGYRTYLYFVATEDPSINVGRVAERVRQGGHPVAEVVIRRRYERSIGCLRVRCAPQAGHIFLTTPVMRTN